MTCNDLIPEPSTTANQFLSKAFYSQIMRLTQGYGFQAFSDGNVRLEHLPNQETIHLINQLDQNVDLIVLYLTSARINIAHYGRNMEPDYICVSSWKSKLDSLNIVMSVQICNAAMPI